MPKAKSFLKKSANYNRFRIVLGIFSVFVIGGIVGKGVFAQTWVEPGSAPPQGNVAAPIWNQTSTVQAGGYNITGNAFIGGNVGIGTTSGTHKLDISGGNSAGSLLNVVKIGSNDFGGAAGDSVALLFGNVNASDYGRIMLKAPGSGGMQLSLGVWNGTSVQDYLNIIKNGNVGIGTANPGEKLEITGAGSTPGLKIIGTTNHLAFRDSAGGNDWWQYMQGGDGKLRFYYSGDKIIFDPNGRIGIGTASPNERLEVNGGIRTTGPTATDMASNGSIDFTSGYQRILSYGADTATRGGISFYNLSSNASLGTTPSMVILPSGNVGIGTTAPDYALHVKTATGQQQLESTSSGEVDFYMKPNGSHTWDFGANSSGWWVYDITSGAYRMAIDQTGNFKAGGSDVVNSPALYASAAGSVGVGTTSPGEKLDVNGRVLLEQTTAPATTTNKLYNVSGNLYWNGTQLGGGSSGVGGSGTTNYVPKFTASTTLGNSQIFDNATGVGIGNTSPSSLLTVGTAGSKAGVVTLAGSASGTTIVQPAASAGNWTLTLPGNTGSNGQVLATNGSGQTSWTSVSAGSPQTPWAQNIDAATYNLTNVGKIGIGTATVNEKLVIGTDLGALAANTAAVVADAAADSAYYVGQGSSNYGALKWTYNATAANAALQISTASYNNPIKIDGASILLQTGSTGSVGIGTTPGFKLDVSDTINGTSTSGYGVRGSGGAAATGGLYGASANAAGYGIYAANSAGGYAGYFSGKVNVVGSFNATGNITQNGTGVCLQDGTNCPGSLVLPPGNVWTVASAPVKTWRGITYGNGTFVAVGDTGAVATSPDGVNWTSRTSATASNNWQAVAYGAGLFVAVASNGTTSTGIMTSPDGITWTSRSVPTTNRAWKAVSFGNSIFVVLAEDNATHAYTSSNGTTWTENATSIGPSGYIRSNLMALGDGNFYFITGDVNSGMWKSANGTSWTGASCMRSYYDSTANHGGSAYGNGTIVTVARNTNSYPCSGDSTTPYLYTSSDGGTTWTQRTTGANGLLISAIGYGNGTFVALQKGTNMGYISTGGATWTAFTTPAVSSSLVWNGVVYGGNKFVAVASDGTVMYSGASVPPASSSSEGDNADLIYNATGTCPSGYSGASRFDIYANWQSLGTLPSGGSPPDTTVCTGVGSAYITPSNTGWTTGTSSYCSDSGWKYNYCVRNGAKLIGNPGSCPSGYSGASRFDIYANWQSLGTLPSGGSPPDTTVCTGVGSAYITPSNTGWTTGTSSYCSDSGWKFSYCVKNN